LPLAGAIIHQSELNRLGTVSPTVAGSKL